MMRCLGCSTRFGLIRMENLDRKVNTKVNGNFLYSFSGASHIVLMQPHEGLTVLCQTVESCLFVCRGVPKIIDINKVSNFVTCYRHKKWSSITRSWPSRDRRSLFAPFVERFDGNWDLNKTDQLFGSIWPQFVEHFSNPGKEILHQLSPFQENMHIFNTPRKFSHVFNNYFYLLSTSTTKSTEIVSHLFHVSRHVTKLTSLLT